MLDNSLQSVLPYNNYLAIALFNTLEQGTSFLSVLSLDQFVDQRLLILMHFKASGHNKVKFLSIHT